MNEEEKELVEGIKQYPTHRELCLIHVVERLDEELDKRIPKKDIQEILDYQYDLWNTPNKQKDFNLELVETLEELLDKE